MSEQDDQYDRKAVERNLALIETYKNMLYQSTKHLFRLGLSANLLERTFRQALLEAVNHTEAGRG